MNKVSFCKYYFVIMCSSVAIAGCRKSYDGPQPAPCPKAFDAHGFKMLNSIEGQSFDSDSIFCGNVSFEAPGDYDDFSWKIGSDPHVFTAQRFSLRFDKPSGTITVQLIAKRKPNPRCFPHDDGIDTLSRELTVLPLDGLTIPYTAIEGKYVGALTDAPGDTFTIHVKRVPLLTDPTQQRLVLTNVNKGCKASPADVTWGYKGFAFNQQHPNYSFDGCDYVTGGGFLDPADRNKIHLRYSQRSSGTALNIPKEFLGQRVK